jgi:site-specific recombinase XerD
MELGEFEKYLRGRQLRPSTVAAYLQAIEAALRSGDPVRAVEMCSSPGHRQQVYAAVMHWARFRNDQDLIHALTTMTRPRAHRTPPKIPLTPRELDVLLKDGIEEQEEPVRQVLVLLALTGLRISDILGIEHRKASQGLEDGTLYLEQKGGDYRAFPVEGTVRRALRELVEEWRWKVLYQVLTDKSRDAAYMVLYRALKESAADAGLDPHRVHPHLMRATAAVHLYQATKDIYAVMLFLGHRSVAHTQTYLRSLFVDAEELSEIWHHLEEARE